MKYIFPFPLIVASLISFTAPTIGHTSNLARNDNPQMRACRVTHSLFTTLQIGYDSVGYCDYNTAIIDSVSILQLLDKKTTWAVESFINSAQVVYSSCRAAGAKNVTSTTSGVISYDICVFGDNSSIEKLTLKNGYNAPSNSNLVQAIESNLN